MGTKVPLPLRFGFSGLEVTLIDYGLSRAKLSNGEIAYNNLETELSVFQGTETGAGAVQFDIYRRMRTHLFFGDHSMKPKSWHTDASRSQSNGKTWKEFTPYSNVIWIRYILNWLIKTYKKQHNDNFAIKDFQAEVREMSRRMDYRTKKDAFGCAREVLDSAFQAGFVNEEQIECFGVDSTMLSEDVSGLSER